MCLVGGQRVGSKKGHKVGYSEKEGGCSVNMRNVRENARQFVGAPRYKIHKIATVKFPFHFRFNRLT